MKAFRRRRCQPPLRGLWATTSEILLAQTMTTWLRLATQLLIRSSCTSTVLRTHSDASDRFITLQMGCDVDSGDRGSQMFSFIHVLFIYSCNKSLGKEQKNMQRLLIFELESKKIPCNFKIFAICIGLQGANASALEKEIGSEQFPVNEHYFGLVNVSILCSVLSVYLVPSASHMLTLPVIKWDFLVWEHLLLQLGTAGSVFLPTIPREDLGIPKSAAAEGEPAHLPGRPLP